MLEDSLYSLWDQAKLRRAKKCKFSKINIYSKHTPNRFEIKQKKGNRPSHSKKDYKKFINYLIDESFTEHIHEEKDEYYFNFRNIRKVNRKLYLSDWLNTNAGINHSKINDPLKDIILTMLDTDTNIVKYVNNRQNSILIQKLIETGSFEDLTIILNCLKPKLVECALDEHGYWVIRKLFEKLDETKRFSIIEIILENFLNLIDHNYGHYLIQFILENGYPKEHSKMNDSLKAIILTMLETETNIVKYVNNRQNSILIQKLIETGSFEDLTIILNCLKPKLVECALDEHGYWVIRKLFEKLDETKRFSIIEIILENFLNLIDHIYGHHLIQFILENGNPKERSLIIQKIFGLLPIVIAQNNKLRSDILKKCTSKAILNNDDMKIIIDATVKPVSERNLMIHRMAKEKYGNYVVSHMIDVLDGEKKDYLISKILIRKKILKKDEFGRYVIKKIKQSYINLE